MAVVYKRPDSLARRKLNLLYGRVRCSYIYPSGDRCRRWVDLDRHPSAREHYFKHGDAFCADHLKIVLVGKRLKQLRRGNGSRRRGRGW